MPDCGPQTPRESPCVSRHTEKGRFATQLMTSCGLWCQTDSGRAGLCPCRLGLPDQCLGHSPNIWPGAGRGRGTLCGEQWQAALHPAELRDQFQWGHTA